MKHIFHLCSSGDLSAAVAAASGRRNPLISAALLAASTSATSLPLGLQIHAQTLKSGFKYDRFVGNNLLSLYFKLCPDFSLTRKLFDELPLKDVVSWTSMVSGFVRGKKPLEALKMFVRMTSVGGVQPNAFTLSAAIKASSDLADVKLGKCFHGIVVARGFETNHVVGSALVDMYGRCFVLGDARKVFDEMLEPDTVCLTSIISSLTRNDEYEEALSLFYQVLWRNEVGVVLDEFMFGTIMTALGNLSRVRQGKEAHAKVITSGFCGNVVVESSVVDMYAKCGLMEESRKVFDRMVRRNAVSWSALLGGYCQSSNYIAVLDLFPRLGKDDDRYSYSTVIRACAGLSAVRQGKEVHCRYFRMGGWRDVVVESALVDFYAKCGLVDYAYHVFIKCSIKNLITWNTMISGFAQNGRGEEAIRLFDQMIQEGTKPDYISFIGVLFACSHSGLVEEGKGYFKMMHVNYGIKAGVEHYNCMVDLFSRAGLIEDAEDLINNSTFVNDSSIWAALLGACTLHTSPDVAERVAKKMTELEPKYHLSYVLLANVYRTVGRWSDALKVGKLMKERGAKKSPGKSWIDAGTTGKFLVVNATKVMAESRVSKIYGQTRKLQVHKKVTGFCSCIY